MDSKELEFTLNFVSQFLREGGASNAEILLAQKRGREILEQQPVDPTESVRFVLDQIKDEFNITTPTLDSDREKTLKGGLIHIKNIEDEHIRTEGLKGFFGIKNKKEGD